LLAVIGGAGRGGDRVKRIGPSQGAKSQFELVSTQLVPTMQMEQLSWGLQEAKLEVRKLLSYPCSLVWRNPLDLKG
jgi:hypothetical protein